MRVPRLSRAARWGYYKFCRKTGELAQAIGAYLYDPDRAVCRAVIGATGGRPIVFTDTKSLFGGSAPGEAAIDRKAAEQAMAAQGMTDPIEQQIHFACLRRAIVQAHQGRHDSGYGLTVNGRCRSRRMSNRACILRISCARHRR